MSSTEQPNEPKKTLRREGINVRLDRTTHAKIQRMAALLTVHRNRKVENAQVVREAIDAYLSLVEKLGG
jgi:hypothetical protein